MNDKNDALPNQHFAFYHQNEALLYQFLMHECLRAHELLRKKPCPTLLAHVLGHLEIGWVKWHAPLGHLPRLMHYCTLLNDHFTLSFNQTKATHTKQLKTSLGRAYSASKKYILSSTQDDAACKKIYTVLRKEIGTFIKVLLEKLPDYRDNASILYFLLDHQKQIDDVYRQAFIKRSFYFLFPEGLDQAYLFFADKFSNRGFVHLIPTIKQKLKQLEQDES